MRGSVSKIETSGFVDGPGIRTVVFLNSCKLRCKYCHNPEMWKLKELNYTALELVQKILHNKEYFGEKGGVTFSGGEPLLQDEFLIEVCKCLNKHHINIALDTAGVGNGNYEELLSFVDLVILDIKDTTPDAYLELTGYKINESLKFIEVCNKLKKKIWLRQVIVPGRNDNNKYLKSLVSFIKKIDNVEKIEFLPYHNLAISKYERLGIDYPYKNIESMDKIKCDELYAKFDKMLRENRNE